MFQKRRLREPVGFAARAATGDEDDQPSSSPSSDAENGATESAPRKRKPVTPMTGMGTRYLDVETITDESLAVAFALAVAFGGCFLARLGVLDIQEAVVIDRRRVDDTDAGHTVREARVKAHFISFG